MPPRSGTGCGKPRATERAAIQRHTSSGSAKPASPGWSFMVCGPGKATGGRVSYRAGNGLDHDLDEASHADIDKTEHCRDEGLHDRRLGLLNPIRAGARQGPMATACKQKRWQKT